MTFRLLNAEAIPAKRSSSLITKPLNNKEGQVSHNGLIRQNEILIGHFCKS
jgi:hypothetical protein